MFRDLTSGSQVVANRVVVVVVKEQGRNRPISPNPGFSGRQTEF